MFEEVRLWKLSGLKKVEFVKDKSYSVSKFEYWIKIYNKETIESSSQQFNEIPFQEAFAKKSNPSDKMMEVDLPSGIKITIYK